MVVESVFSWPGVGRLLVVAVANRDLAVVQCILLLVAATMVASNLVVDLLYGLLDPRLRTGRGEARRMTDQALIGRLRTPAQPPPRQRRADVPLAVKIAIAWLVGMMLIAIFADVIAPYSFTALDLRNRLAPPGNAAAPARHRRTRPRRAVAPDRLDPHFAC